MHLRFSTCNGVPVVEDGSGSSVGRIIDILIHPDTGKVEGFFVHVPGGYPHESLFLSTYDIMRWGTAVHVRTHEMLAPLEDRERLKPLLDDHRTFLKQKIRTEGGRKLGRCADVQFDTDDWHVEWIFPKRYFRWGVPLPIVEVIEVRKDAIIVRNQTKLAKEKVPPEPVKILKQISEIAEEGVRFPH